MKFSWQITALLIALLLPSLPARAEDPRATTNLIGVGEATSESPSPIAVFRQLLAMKPEQLEIALAPYAPDRRQRIRDKIEEYQMLPSEFRELRLRVTELRWYLMPFLLGSVTNISAGLEHVPEPFRKLVQTRVDEWQLLPPDLKTSVLEYQGMLDHFVARDASGKMIVQSAPLPAGGTDADQQALELKLAHWQALSENERRQVYASFEHYLTLNNSEKQEALDALPSLERAEAEKVLDPIETWPKSEQEKYLSAFRKFAQMSAPERTRFLSSARRWHQMSAAERQAWRDLLQQIAEQPPPPPDIPGTGGGSSIVAPTRTNPATDRVK